METHLWIPAGKAIFLGKWQYENKEFQIWQRKNESNAEPFATGLFVRHGTNEWRVYCLDFEDGYSPKIELRETGSEVHVFRNAERMGAFNTTKQTFRRGTNLPVETAVRIGYAEEPPGKWWLK